VGKVITVNLRNGLSTHLTLRGVGPFDVLLGTDADELFVPLHAMMSWSVG
jgi:sRNA-binding regulator protein Hfq